MLPTEKMLAKNNRVTGRVFLLLVLAVLVAGCRPAGPRALLDGKRLLDAGRYEQAAEKLQTATKLLGTNAHAWNYLGLAYHRAGQPTNAEAAYRRAIALDQNLAVARFNLGCLWLEQNQFEAAKEQLTSYTMQTNRAVEGFLKLGMAQFRLRELGAAEATYRNALRLNAQNPEALNGLGLIQLQRNRPQDAAQYFHAALKQQPHYRPALLNLATVSLRYLNDASGALQRYRQYLAITPRAADWATVNAIVQSLERQLASPPHAAASAVASQSVASPAAPKPEMVRVAAPTKVDAPPSVVKVTPAPSAPPAPAPAAPTVVTLAPEPTIKAAPHSSPSAARVIEPERDTSAPPALVMAPPPPKRSFFQWLNPFRRSPKPSTKVTPLPANATEPSPGISSPEPTTPRASPSPPASRYTYLSPASPPAGDRAAAERAFAAGVQFQRANRLKEAAAAYQRALQSDARYFEAHYNLGLVGYLSGNYRQSLASWENALAIRPDSTDARYNFALALKAAGHPRDAANELEKILTTSPEEVRVHLVLGNLYVEALADPTKARTHYLKVLELDPRHPQGTAIRYWLVANPL